MRFFARFACPLLSACLGPLLANLLSLSLCATVYDLHILQRHVQCLYLVLTLGPEEVGGLETADNIR